MIFQGTTPRALSWTAVAALLVCGAAFLPLRPTWGQDRTSSPSGDATPAASTPAPGTTAVAQQTTPASGTKIAGPEVSGDVVVTGSLSAPRDIDEAKDAVELMQAQLEAKKAELREARALVEQSRRQVDRLSKLQAQRGVSEEEVEQARDRKSTRLNSSH